MRAIYVDAFVKERFMDLQDEVKQSGQRFLDSSDPRLIRQTASCETAGGGDWSSLEWDTYPQPAGKDEKLSREFEGGAINGRAVGAVHSSLDLLKNNRNTNGKVPDYYLRPMGRGKFCGRCTIKGIDPKTGRTKYKRLNCRSWSCSYCGPRRANMARRAIKNKAEEIGLRYFLTLTMDPKKIEHRKLYVPMLRLAFNKFRIYLRRKFGKCPPYISVMEFTQNGVPHLHLLLDRYIPQEWVSDVWDTLGGGRIVFIKRVTVHKVARYLSKYLTKDLLLSAPKGSRRICCSRSIKLFPKFESGIAWALVKSSIWFCLADERMRQWAAQANLYETISIEFDEESLLKAFEIHNLWSDRPKEESPCVQ